MRKQDASTGNMRHATWWRGLRGLQGWSDVMVAGWRHGKGRHAGADLA